jgi:predicted dehydrogenase
MLKIGIVGARGTSTILGFQAMEGVEVSAICDLNEDLCRTLAGRFGIRNTYRVFEDMLESDVDAVVVATPMQCHVPQAMAALQAGKHVLSEVTAGVTLDELWWLIENVEASGKVYMMAENYCYMPDNQLILSLVKAGVLGEVYYGEGEYLHHLPGLCTYPNGKTSWRKYWQLGKRGAFYPTHSIGPVMQWFEGDRIESVTSFGSGRHNEMDLRQEDTSVTMCQLASGKLARVRLDCLSPRPHQMTYYTVQGTNGVVESSRIAGEESKIWVKGMEPSTDEARWHPLGEYKAHLPQRYRNATDEQRHAGHGGGDFFLVEDFVRAITEGTPPPIDVYKACEWTAVALLSELSITNRSRTLDMPHFRRNMPFHEQHLAL